MAAYQNNNVINFSDCLFGYILQEFHYIYSTHICSDLCPIDIDNSYSMLDCMAKEVYMECISGTIQHYNFIQFFFCYSRCFE